ncbi:Stress responsive A/B Barrel Domain [Kaistia soli DSM 19436]|uniref:Stress responsive A/B Barrel Domain n=1 Tax=Kaistia soli DSM 19436 TaxID=1122133 RepID=A0A1M4VZ21_9HYPH|nr:Dabb family protein [Kaistia soli]SHE73962.1 Stress responsive A/B Barrel Domain [Kaistia soli DSM 19436]
MIRHTVVFRLHHAKGSAPEAAFLDAARVLGRIPGVEAFERLRQVSPKNGFDFGFSMEFADASAYEGYNTHPDHVAFVRDRWIPEVAEFLEIDYAPL